jgi:hypothetical protein
MRACLLLILITPAYAWGFWAHRRINRLAVFTLPETLFAFYRPQIEYLTRQATKPDERRGAFAWEAPRHYIDLDRYEPPLPHRWQEAIEKYTLDTLSAHGLLPWHLEKAFWDLVNAMKAHNTPRILKLSAEIGHYLADAHVPLHTTANYNGQLTGQHGIHALWESFLPERYGESYDFFVPKARFWRSIRDTIWKIIAESHALVPAVLEAEIEASRRLPPDKKYTYRQRGNQTIRTYSEAFLEVYHALLQGMVEDRLRKAIHRLGSLWYTAWVLAGRPDLSAPPAPVEDEPVPPDSTYQEPRPCGEVGLAPQNLPYRFPGELLPVQQQGMLVDFRSEAVGPRQRQNQNPQRYDGFPSRHLTRNQPHGHVYRRREREIA